MTTTISFTTRDCIVLGCDSLATSSRRMIDPAAFSDAFLNADGTLKLVNGLPVLQTAQQLYEYTQAVPQDQLPSVTKLYELRGIPAGLLFSGASVVGQLSIKNLIDKFLSSSAFNETAFKPEMNLKSVADAFFHFVSAIYDEAYAQVPDDFKPASEVILSGYSEHSHLPEIFRINFSATPSCENALPPDRQFDMVFSGQYDIIQRVVLGVDLHAYFSLRDKSRKLLEAYRSKLQATLTGAGLSFELQAPDMADPDLQLFHGDFGGVRGLYPNRESLSEQAAINLVEFLVDTMIRAQQFSGSIPTVGGDIHIAIITKADGFRWVSKEEYLFRGNSVPKHAH